MAAAAATSQPSRERWRRSGDNELRYVRLGERPVDNSLSVWPNDDHAGDPYEVFAEAPRRTLQLAPTHSEPTLSHHYVPLRSRNTQPHPPLGYDQVAEDVRRPFRGSLSTPLILHTATSNTPTTQTASAPLHPPPVPPRSACLYSNLSQNDSSATPPPLPPPRPPKTLSGPLSVGTPTSQPPEGFYFEVNSCGPLQSEPWYAGALSKTEANALLMEDGLLGAFLVRQSDSKEGQHVLSFIGDGMCVCHVRISNCTGRYMLVGSSYRSFNSLQELIRACREGQFLMADTGPCPTALRLTRPCLSLGR